MQHIVSIDDLDQDFITEIFEMAQQFKKDREVNFAYRPLAGRLLITDFFEPSTRTRLSFEAAMTYLGGNVIGTENAAEFSSVKKGESIADNFKVISNYCDIIVGRFRNEGDARIAADACDVPLINGGDGAGEHPTQALIDLFIIQDKLSNRDRLTVTFIGDNEHSRTVKSLVKLLSRDPRVTVNFFQSNWDFFQDNFQESRMLAQSDVVYITRNQKERHTEEQDFGVFTPRHADLLPEHALILHPLPRTTELPEEVDKNPRAHYFEQARNGLYIRMALLNELCL